MTEMTPREKRVHAALRELIAEAGGCGEAAAAIGLKKAQLGRMHVDPPEAFMNVFQLSKLEGFVGKPVVTQAMAAMLGFDITPQDRVIAKDACIHASIGTVMGEATQLARTYSELVADGISPTDAALMEAELRDAARAIEQARQACAAIQAKRKP